MQVKSSHSIEKFTNIVQEMGAMPTDKIVEALDRQNYWDKDRLELVTLEWKRDFVRKMLGRVRDDSGSRLFHNIEVTDSKGRRSRAYKHRDKMSVDEYKQAIRAYWHRGQQGILAARALIRDCRQVHGVQLRLPFGPG